MKSRSVRIHLCVVLSSLVSFVLSLTNAFAIESAESRTFLKLTCQDASCAILKAAIHEPTSIRAWERPLYSSQLPFLGLQVKRWVESIRGDSIDTTGFSVWADTTAKQMEKGMGKQTLTFRFDLGNGLEDLIEWVVSGTLGAARNSSAPTTVSTTYDPAINGDFNPMLAGYYPAGFRLRAKDSNRELYFGYSPIRSGGGIDYEGSFFLGHKGSHSTQSIGSSVKLVIKEQLFGKSLMRAPVSVFPKYARTLFPDLSGSQVNELAEWTAPFTKVLENGGVKFREVLKRGTDWQFDAITVSEKEFDGLLASVRAFELPSMIHENATYRSGRRCRVDVLNVGLPSDSDGEVVEQIQKELVEIGLPSVKSTPTAPTVRLALWSTLYKGMSRNLRVKPDLREENTNLKVSSSVKLKWILKNVTAKNGNKTTTQKRACASALVSQAGMTASWVDLGCGAELFSNLEAAGQKISQDAVCPADVN